MMWVSVCLSLGPWELELQVVVRPEVGAGHQCSLEEQQQVLLRSEPSLSGLFSLLLDSLVPLVDLSYTERNPGPSFFT